MRLSLRVLGLLVGMVGISAPANAQNYPWCAVYNMGDAATNCGFDTFEQCRISLSGMGGFCEKNNTYVPPPPDPAPALPPGPAPVPDPSHKAQAPNSH
jgi:hypothetical protein